MIEPDYPDYRVATNAAYELLARYYGKLPVIDVFSILDLIPGGSKQNYIPIRIMLKK